jgi:2',3'-cyclic-nucleotide 2'-phosphodiesterase (5'-nucleotidase family)
VRLRGRRVQRTERLFALLAVLVAIALIVPGVMLARKPAAPPVTVQFLNVSDWHGQIDPLDIFGVGLRGGASVISSYWQRDRANHDGPTVAVTAGDDIGATPPISNFFDERPAILAQRMMGIDFGTLGNHNFDRGVDHLQEMIDLARSRSAGVPGEPFQYVSANLENVKENLSHVKPYQIVKLGGVKVAFIGITNPEAPEVLFPGSLGTINITDSAAAANAARADARKKGAQVVVALIHAGVRGFTGGDPNQPFGELIDFANAVNGFDVIFGDHTDVQYSGVINGALVQENRSKGRTYSRTFVTVTAAGEVTDKWIEFDDPICLALVSATDTRCANTPVGPPDPALEAMLQPFRDELGPILAEIVGHSTVAIPWSDKCGTGNGRSCESLVGNTVTDAMRDTYGTDFAITNSGGLRAQLTCPPGGGGSGNCPVTVPPPFPITVGQVLTVLPFGNQSVTLELTGAQFKAMLENGVSREGAQGRFPQVSGLCFTYDIQQPAGSRVTGAVFQAADGSCTGSAVNLTSAATYSVTTNDFVASGGDVYPNYSAFMVTRNIMANDVVDWVKANDPISPAIQGRITCTDSDPATAPACPTVLP